MNSHPATALVFSALLAPLALAAPPAALYVSPSGDDKNPGTLELPFKTITTARDAVRKGGYNRAMQKDFVVYLRGGRYELTDTLYFDARDSGSNNHSVVYQAYEKEQPVISGGLKVTDWKAVAGKPYFAASVPQRKPVKSTNLIKDNRSRALNPAYYQVQDLSDEGFASYFRQIYVNGVRAEIARSNDVRTSSRKEWWDDTTTTDAFRDGIYIKKSDIKNYTNPEDMRILWLEIFKTLDAPVAGLIPCPDNKDEMIFKMKQSEFLIGSSWSGIKPVTQFFIVNALEELDEPGEWYLDQKKDLVYYYPRAFDGDINQAEVYAPRVEGLVKFDGTPQQRVHHLRLDGLTLEHGNWADPKDHYLGISQAEIYRTYTSEFPGQIVLNYSDNVSITGCTIRHMGSCGIQLYEGCNHTVIQGNITDDTTGAGITVGKWWLHSEECPSDSVCTDTLIADNVVRNTGRDYWQATGINLFAAYDARVYHNDVSDTAYTIIHARNGDSGFVHPRIGKIQYKWNKVSNGFAGHKWDIGDGGHLYLHGRYPDSEVSENYSLHANRYVNMEYYSDNFSHTTQWNRNVSQDSHAKEPFRAWHPANVNVTFDGNYSNLDSKSVGNGKQTNFHWIKDGQWPAEAQKIMDNAGLEPQWRHLADRIYGHDNLAEGKVYATSSDSDAGHSSTQGADNDWKSFWQGKADAAGPCWWSVDLGQAYVIQKVGILPIQDKYEASARKNLEIQASNEPNFKTHVVLAKRNDLPWYQKTKSSNLWEEFINVPQGYRYLRVISTDPKAVLSMSEFFAYGYRQNPVR